MIKIEKELTYRGILCVITFHNLGYRCGYVRVPKENKYYRRKALCEMIDCHGGITYQGSHLPLRDDKNAWWIGFDCSHSCDGYDVEKAREIYKESEKDMRLFNELESIKFFDIFKNKPVRTAEYCEAECKKIVDQILQ